VIACRPTSHITGDCANIHIFRRVIADFTVANLRIQYIVVVFNVTKSKCVTFAKLIVRAIWFRSHFVQTLNTWRLMYHELSRSTVKGQGHNVSASKTL